MGLGEPKIDNITKAFAAVELDAITADIAKEFPSIVRQLDFDLLIDDAKPKEFDELTMPSASARRSNSASEAIASWKAMLKDYLIRKVDSGDFEIVWRRRPYLDRRADGIFQVVSRLAVIPYQVPEVIEEATLPSILLRDQLMELPEAMQAIEKICPQHSGEGPKPAFDNWITIYAGGGREDAGEPPALFLSRRRAIGALVHQFERIVAEDRPSFFEIDGGLIVDKWTITITDSKNSHRVASVRYSAQAKVRFAG